MGPESSKRTEQQNNPGLSRHPFRIEPGAVFAKRYTLQQRIAEGSMADIWLARNEQNIRVALKIIHTDVHGERKIQEKALIGEAAVFQRIYQGEDSVFPKMFEHDVFKSWRYIAIEYIEGETLDALIHDMGRKKIPFCRALEICMSVLNGLGSMHDQGLIHRDLKPANIMIGNNKKVWLIDFDLTVGAGHVCEEGGVEGTPAYMSPEQTANLPLDHRSDIYSLGLTMYEMITRKNPMNTKNPYSVFLNQQTKPMPEIEIKAVGERFKVKPGNRFLVRIRDYFLGRKVEKLHAALNNLIQGMTRKDREKRFGNIDEILVQMEKAKNIAEKLAKYEII